jgi:hypothetical protein
MVSGQQSPWDRSTMAGVVKEIESMSLLLIGCLVGFFLGAAVFVIPEYLYGDRRKCKSQVGFSEVRASVVASLITRNSNG